MNRILAFVICCCGVVVQAAQLPVSIVPFTFAGRITDYAHIAYDADAAVEVRLKNAAGDLLAKTTTQTSGVTCYNYVLPVPVSTQKMKGYATVGEKVTFEFVDPYGKVYAGLVAEADAVIGNPGVVKRLDVVLATDADGDGVADEYLESIEYWMWLNGIEGPYDAKADYDGDGHSNYEEYVAGTNPCDPADKFSIRQMALEMGLSDYVRLRIPVTQGRSYTVEETARLETPEWRQTSFTEDAEKAPAETHLNTGASEVGYRTIFVKKDGPQHFYKVTVE